MARITQWPRPQPCAPRRGRSCWGTGGLRAQAFAAGPAWQRGGPGPARRPHRGGAAPIWGPGRGASPRSAEGELRGAVTTATPLPGPRRSPVRLLPFRSAVSRDSRHSGSGRRRARAGNLHASPTRPFTTHLQHVLKTLTPKKEHTCREILLTTWASH